MLQNIFKAIHDGSLEEVKRIFNEGPQHWIEGNHLLDHAIGCRRLKIAQFLYAMGERPNIPQNYRDGIYTPIHQVAFWGHTEILKWVFKEKVLLLLDVLKIKDFNGWTPLDFTIAYGRLETAKYLWEMDGRPNPDAYRDGIYTPVHSAAQYRYTEILKWVFAEDVLPLRVLNIKNMGNSLFCLQIERKGTPLDCAIFEREWETAALLQRLLFNSIFLAMQRAKRDYRCMLRRLPNELLDMVVDEVAARFHHLRVVVW